MASLQKERTGKFHIVIFSGGKRHKRSLGTTKPILRPRPPRRDRRSPRPSETRPPVRPARHVAHRLRDGQWQSRTSRQPTHSARPTRTRDHPAATNCPASCCGSSHLKGIANRVLQFDPKRKLGKKHARNYAHARRPLGSLTTKSGSWERIAKMYLPRSDCQSHTNLTLINQQGFSKNPVVYSFSMRTFSFLMNS